MSLFGSVKEAVEAVLRDAVESLTRKDTEQDASLAALEARVTALEEASTGGGSARQTGAQGAARGRSVKAKPTAATAGGDASGT